MDQDSRGIVFEVYMMQNFARNFKSTVLGPNSFCRMGSCFGNWDPLTMQNKSQEWKKMVSWNPTTFGKIGLTQIFALI